MNTTGIYTASQGRRVFLILCLLLAFITLLWRAIGLQVLDKDFLQTQGEARHLRIVKLPAHRGMIRDRHGEPLAVSTPVESVWANPQELAGEKQGIAQLRTLLELEAGTIQQLLASHAEREFIYLRRHLTPAHAQQVKALQVPGVYLQREYRRYYPAGEVAAHVIGFTDIDDRGQEGLELAFGDWLRGEPGAKRVIMDGQRHVVEDVESIRRPDPGKDLTLSIDRRIQYLAYRELKAAMAEHKAHSASAVMLDAGSGEILAMVNQPSYNPNNRQKLQRNSLRNRAVTDVFEPGSTIKPFIVASALESGRYTPHTLVSTAPGWFRVGVNTVRDVHDYGELDVTGVIRKSSNVGISKIALSLPHERIWELLSELGLGVSSGSGFPGEASGLLVDHHRWNDIETATLSYGYGVSVTPLQLAKSYATLAAGGIMRPVTFLRQDTAVQGRQLFPREIARQTIDMLEEAAGPQGTAPAAQIAGYRVAGKTGTVRKSVPGGYSDDRYVSVFAGMAPASQPRLVLVVMINEPDNGRYYGGQVAAPVFAQIMSGALRLMAVPPDDLPLLETRRTPTGESA